MKDKLFFLMCLMFIYNIAVVLFTAILILKTGHWWALFLILACRSSKYKNNSKNDNKEQKS